MAAQQKHTDTELAITAYGLKTVAGNQDFALFGAVAAMLTTGQEDTEQYVPSRSGDGVDPSLTAANPKFANLNPENRIYIGLLISIVESTNFLIENHLEHEKHILLIVLPASNFERRNYINTDEWKKNLSQQLRQFTNLVFVFINADDNVTKNLQSACAALNDGVIESVIFAGSGSLLDEITCQELIAQNRLCSTTISDGVIPGEAAASVVQCCVAQFTARTTTRRLSNRGIRRTPQTQTAQNARRTLPQRNTG